MNHFPHSVDLVVLVNGFPRLSETFVLQELLDLERRGVRLHVVALRRPDEVVRQDALATLQADVEYLPEGGPAASKLAVRLAHASLFLERRAGYLNGVADAYQSPDFSRATLTRAALLAHRARRLGAKALYIHFAHKTATVGRLAALLAGLPYGLSAHAKDIWLTSPAELAAKVRDAAVVLTCTSEGREYLGELAGAATPVHLVHHGVETTVTSAGHDENAPVRVLAVGRLIEKKGYDTLIRAAELIRARGLDFSLRIVGEGPEWPRLQRLVHELKLAETVSFLGPLSELETQREYEAADVFALACRQLANGDRDGIPNVILEAMAHALPVASTRAGGIAEAVADEETGLLASQDDETAFAERLALLIADCDLRRRLGSAGHERARAQFDREKNLPAVYEALASNGIVSRSNTAGAGLGLRAVA